MPSKLCLLLCSILIVLHAGCAPITPELTEKEKKELDDAAHPYITDVLYDQALAVVGEYINSQVSYRKIIQPKQIGNTAGGSELPFNLTNMVITSLSRLSGKNLIVAPYDPEYINNDAVTGGRGSRVLPDLIIAGSITEFDKDVDASESEFNLDLLIDQGKPNTNLGIGAYGGKKMSRITLDLYLLDYRTHAVIPGVSVTNTVNVVEISKNRDYAFAIYGSGLGIGGRIKHTQGFHRAVRNLVDYSVLQLMGKYYNLPYWRALGIDNFDPEVMRSLVRSFERKSPQKQIMIIQRLLKKYKLNPHGLIGRPILANGVLDEQTQRYIDAFCQQYNVSYHQRDMEGLFVELIKKLPLDVHLKGRATGTEGEGTTSPQKFYDSVDRVEKVYRIPAILD